jgi:signal transduction histidine kinase
VTGALNPVTLGQLIGLLAHDLRNPLSALHSNVGFLDSVVESADDDVREALQDARVSCDGLMYIIDNLELLGRSLSESSESPEIPMTSLDLMPVLEDVVARHHSLAVSHGVALRLESVPTAGCVLSNRDMLGRAVGNLVRNAIQYGLPGGSVDIIVRHEPRVWVVRVEDAGPPLCPALIERAFEPDAQIELKSATGGRYSRGLGLFAARLAADSIHATVRACVRLEGASALELALPEA